MSGSLLDTSVLIAHDAAGALELPATAAISVISLGELRAGVLIASDARVAVARRQRLDAVRSAFAPLPVDKHVAELYGDVLLGARAQGRTAKGTGLLIIATAAANQRQLTTLDAAQARLAEAAAIPVALL